jgi:hypothetical protein
LMWDHRPWLQGSIAEPNELFNMELSRAWEP